jgi:hypothetical protein
MADATLPDGGGQSAQSEGEVFNYQDYRKKVGLKGTSDPNVNSILGYNKSTTKTALNQVIEKRGAVARYSVMDAKFGINIRESCRDTASVSQQSPNWAFLSHVKQAREQQNKQALDVVKNMDWLDTL